MTSTEGTGGDRSTVDAPWMHDPAVRRVVNALQAGGAEVRFVGGCVRDLIAGRPIKDIDLATPERPEQVIERADAAGLRVVPTGIEHGTVTIVADGRPYEVTTLRRDVETDGRRATVAFTDDWHADAERRDFTFNAMSLSPDGGLFDPFGGVQDLTAGIVRFVGDPWQRIAEDRLRVLRLFRFQARFGRAPPDPTALQACRNAIPSLGALSGERVGAELSGLLGSDHPAEAVTMMIDTGILSALIPSVRDASSLSALVTVEGVSAETSWIRRLAALLPQGDRAAAERASERLRLSRHQHRRLLHAVQPDPPVGPGYGVAWHRAACHRRGAQTVRDRLLLAWASQIAVGGRPDRLDTEAWRELVDLATVWTPKSLPISGADVRALGVEPGPEIGKLLSAVEDWWVAGEFEADRATCLDRLEALVGEGHLSPG